MLQCAVYDGLVMTNIRNQKDQPSDAPLTDEEFDAWWPFSDDDLDEYERELEESLRHYEWVPPPHLDQERRLARMRIRHILAEQYTDGLLGYKAVDSETPTEPNTATVGDDDS